MFASKQVFVSQDAKTEFFNFLVDRINSFAVSVGDAINSDPTWKVADLEKILEDYSFKNIQFPFGEKQLSEVVDMLRNAPYGTLFRRYTTQEIVTHIYKNYVGFPDGVKVTLRDYLHRLVSILQEWDDCPAGFVRTDSSEIVDFLSQCILEAGRVSREEPKVISIKEVPKDPKKSQSSSSSSHFEQEEPQKVIEVVKDEPKKTLRKTVTEAPEEDSTEEEEPEKPVLPPKADKADEAKSKEAKIVTPYQGPRLVNLVKRIASCLEVELDKSPNKRQILDYCRDIGKPPIREYILKIARTIMKFSNLDESEFEVDSIVEAIILEEIEKV